MAHGNLAFFNPDCPLTVGSDWDFQTNGPRTRTVDVLTEFNSSGNVLRSALGGVRLTGSWMFVNNLSTGKISIPKVGLVNGGYHIDSIQITWSRDQMKPKMTVNAHSHPSGTDHAPGSCRTYSATITPDAVTFGIPADFGGLALAAGAVVDFRSVTYTLQVTHLDEAARDGNQLVGENHNGQESLEVDLTGEVAMDDYTVGSGWLKQSTSVTPSNTGVTTSHLSFIKFLTHDAVAATAGVQSLAGTAGAQSLAGTDTGDAAQG